MALNDEDEIMVRLVSLLCAALTHQGSGDAVLVKQTSREYQEFVEEELTRD